MSKPLTTRKNRKRRRPFLRNSQRETTTAPSNADRQAIQVNMAPPMLERDVPRPVRPSQGVEDP